jgi:hypothetical protein
MTRKNETMKKLEPKAGALYETLKYTKKGCLIRFFPVWFMLKRFIFVLMVFNFSYTHGMVLFSIGLNLIEMLVLARKKPYNNSYDNKIALFNIVTAYVFLVILQIFSQ